MEAEERLAAFEQVDGHWRYKEGITESTTTVRPGHTDLASKCSPFICKHG